MHVQVNVRMSAAEKRRLDAEARQRGLRGAAELLRVTVAATRSYPTYTIRIHPADPDERGYWAEVPALPGCNTQGDTYAETIAHAREAIKGYIEMLVKQGEPIPVEVCGA